MANMTDAQLSALLVELTSLPDETEWVEFQHNDANPEEIGRYLSALANSAALHDRETAYLVWGIEDGTHKVIGTSFRPRKAKGKGNEDLEPWLMRGLDPQVNFQIHEWAHRNCPVVLFQIPRATHQPLAFYGERFIRVGSHKKKLKDLPSKEAELWATFSKTPFESGIAKANLPGDEVLSLINFTGCFDAMKITLPTNQAGILRRLAEEALIVRKPGGLYDITNVGAVLFAKNLGKFHRIGRKAIRVIKFKGSGRTETEREWRDPPSQQGYAFAFDAAVAFINSQLPQNEPIGQAFRTVVRMYPEKAIRELVANALIHQDFSVTGAGPMVEIFTDRIEITNPGEPLVDTIRFIDASPKTRNEDLAALMRRMTICEEAGTGIDKAISAIEAFQLPAPDFRAVLGFTKAFLYAPRNLTDMSFEDRIRACYQHASLCFVSGRRMTNTSLRQRFGIEERNATRASRIIAETLKAGRIRPFDPEQGKKYASYLPFWA
jgi:ATP-dependent DNA helicase RecG